MANNAITINIAPPTVSVGISRQGAPGREIELQAADGYIQWRYVGYPTWTNLLALQTMNGATTFADAASRTAAVPTCVGQFGYQLDTGILYRSTALTTGSWVAANPAMVGAATSAHTSATTGVHGVGAGTVAKTADITKAAVGLSNVADALQVQADVLHANSLLYATADHTPAQLLLAANKFAARASTGDILAKDVSDLALTMVARATAALMRGDLGAAPLAAVKHIWLPAGAAIPRATNGAASGTVEAATNDVMYDTFDFDSATAEGIAWVITLPGWDLGTIKFKPVWTAATGSGTFILAVSGRAYPDDDAIDQGTGTAQTSTDTLITAGDIHIGPASAPITVAGTLAANLPIILQGIRDISDTLSADARLLGIIVEYTQATTEEAAW